MSVDQALLGHAPAPLHQQVDFIAGAAPEKAEPWANSPVMVLLEYLGDHHVLKETAAQRIAAALLLLGDQGV